MKLSTLFESLAYKKLASVDLPNKNSHQHELNGSRPLGKLLGYEKLKSAIQWRCFTDSDQVLTDEGDYTWYDAREKSSSITGRSEWRFYYTGNFLGKAVAGDTLILAKRTSGQILGLIFRNKSQWLENVTNLFGLSGQSGSLHVIENTELFERDISPDNPLIHALGIDLDHQFSNEDENLAQPRSQNTEFKFRPAARLIATIGQNLIKDPPAALLELVKNSYDADSSLVSIKIEMHLSMSNEPLVKFSVTDNGHGMSQDVVVNNWLVPATPNKANRKYSPSGRRMQGNKGIGRYAAFILGNELLLKTAAEQLETTILLDWRDFEKYEYLDQVPVLVETAHNPRSNGTIFEISGDSYHAAEWDEAALSFLRMELRKLISPFRDESDPFAIRLQTSGFPGLFSQFEEYVQPLSLVEFSDYRLSGKIDENGRGSLLFENNVDEDTIARDIEISVPLLANQKCGPIEVDLRVFDRDPEAIEELISRGLHDPDTGNELSKREARSLLDASSGVSIYRGDFKIRPYGDPGFDWIELDKTRVQNPSLRIGSNQIVGFIRVGIEEVSHLEEKSARDGLKEDSHYAGLKLIVKAALAELEERRFVFRKSAGRGRKTVKVDHAVNQLTDYHAAASKIKNLLISSNVPADKIQKVQDILDQTGREKQELVGQIRDAIAIYQGQATLGKIIMVLLHEGRKPVGYFKDMAPILAGWLDRLRVAADAELMAKLISRLENVVIQAKLLTTLFDRLEPLSVRKRHKPVSFMLFPMLEKSIAVFEKELETLDIIVSIDPALDISVSGWDEDILLIFTNLIENSLYWMREHKTNKPEIEIGLIVSSYGPTLLYNDNGPGIPEFLIQDQSLFEPGFSSKKGGTGLGLAIAGEAAERNGFKLKAYHDNDGARFVLELFPGIK